VDPDGLVAARSAWTGAEPSPARRPILVVDDSLTSRMLEQSILESAGYAVEVAASGEEGLHRARAVRHALYLVDIEMPGMDGFTFVERTRADPELKDTPAILVSSRASAEDRRRGAAAGACHHVDKAAFDQKELLAHIGKLVG
jgi:two-component system chemotaxis sensor kinase CheA